MSFFGFIRKETSVENPEKRFRLRQDEQVVGYMRKVSARMVLYSRDGFWWKGHKIPYNALDEFTGLKDKNNQYLYEWDILRFKLDPDEANYRQGVILWEANQKHFGIKDLDEGQFVPLFVSGVAMFNPRQLEVFSYLFLNPELKEQLGVRD